LISDYFQNVEKKISKTSVVAEKAIDFREFDINEGFVMGKILFIDGSALEFLEYLKDDIRLKYRFHYMNEKGALIFRYDNAPHHQVTTFPDHKHTSEGVIASVPQELSSVVDEIERLISARGWA
jgi:hypothetical protein